MRPELEAPALGALQGAAELLPVSSSAHVAAVPWLLGWAPRDKAFEVALHAGAAAALAPALLRGLPRPRTLAFSLAPPVIAGYAFEDAIESCLAGPVALAGGLLAGGLALAAADRRPETRAWRRPERRRGVAARWGRTETPRGVAPRWRRTETPRGVAPRWGRAETPRR